MDKLIFIIILHVIGDHVFQWASLSVRKRSELLYLLLHTSIYCVVLAIGSFIFLYFQNVNNTLLFILINIVLHFGIDLITGKIKEKSWAQTESANFTLISLDQIIHLTILFTTYYYISKQSLLIIIPA
jgi:hypothetical protein